MQDSQDRRQKRVYPTEAAKQIANDVQRELYSFDDLLTQGLTPQHLELLYEALVQMDRNLSAPLGIKRTGGTAQ